MAGMNFNVGIERGVNDTHPFSRRLPLHCKEGQCEDVFVALLSSTFSIGRQVSKVLIRCYIID